ncbi:MAG: hypothetical protein IT365_11190 [Candidatus Hydrogenedentes bacterium]|nr:hypothetical protein [Candidatus Hydrogenedentota bacterium]
MTTRAEDKPGRRDFIALVREIKGPILTVLVVCLVWALIVGCSISSAWEWDVFGDSFGILNAVFSGLAFVILIAALLSQKEELALQREELKLTREELNRQCQELERQASALDEQVNSTTFFQLLALLANAAESAICRSTSPRNGNLAFQDMAHSLQLVYVESLGRSEQHSDRATCAAWKDVGYQVEELLGHYLAVLEATLVALKRMGLSRRDRFPELLAMQLSEPQLYLLSFALAANGLNQSLRDLICEFALFRKLKESDMLSRWQHPDLLPNRACCVDE